MIIEVSYTDKTFVFDNVYKFMKGHKEKDSCDKHMNFLSDLCDKFIARVRKISTS